MESASAEPSMESASADLNAMVENFKDLELKHKHHLELARSTAKVLANGIAEFEEEKKKFLKTKVAVEGVLDQFKRRVKLNVGGCKFETTLTTLTADGDDSLLGAMFSGRHEMLTNEDREVFIDRDGTHFGHILNILRDCAIDVPIKDRSALQSELKYHGISTARQAANITYANTTGVSDTPKRFGAVHHSRPHDVPDDY